MQLKKDDRRKLFELKMSVAKIFRKKCFVCGALFYWNEKKYKENNTFTLHHLQYFPAEKIYDNFTMKSKTGKTIPDTLSYYRYLIPLVKATPKRFLFVCHSCHYSIEKLKRFGKAKRNKLIKAVRLSDNYT
jgi:hypothetical protein